MRTLITTTGKQSSTATDQIVQCFSEAREMGFWLDIEAPDDADYELLEHTFKFHPLTIEDIKHQEQRPKVDEYPDYNFTVIFQALWEDDNVVFREHHLYVGPSYLISVHVEPSPALKELQGEWVVISRNRGVTEGMSAVITGDRMKFLRNGQVMTEWVILLDVTKEPRVFDRKSAGENSPSP